jgi:Zn-dependent M16 (insulinase) family peptidase
MTTFELKQSFEKNNVGFRYYQSKSTGLTVAIGLTQSPLCKGYFSLSTEAHDDDGLPHTLEHLIFMGSHRYPFKGLLGSRRAV